MLKQTLTAIGAILESDVTLSPEQRKIIVAYVKNPSTSTPTAALPRIIRRDEAARLIGVTPKRCDQIAALGHLIKIMLPGTTRAIGFSESSVRALVENRMQGSEVLV
jgi:hypothetical protein